MLRTGKLSDLQVHESFLCNEQPSYPSRFPLNDAIMYFFQERFNFVTLEIVLMECSYIT